jgi:hypothetical protein
LGLGVFFAAGVDGGQDGEGVEGAATVVFSAALCPFFEDVTVVEKEVGEEVALVEVNGLFQILAALLADVEIDVVVVAGLIEEGLETADVYLDPGVGV